MTEEITFVFTNKDEDLSVDVPVALIPNFSGVNTIARGSPVDLPEHITHASFFRTLSLLQQKKQNISKLIVDLPELSVLELDELSPIFQYLGDNQLAEYSRKLVNIKLQGVSTKFGLDGIATLKSSLQHIALEEIKTRFGVANIETLQSVARNALDLPVEQQIIKKGKEHERLNKGITFDA
jgi:hypothetical protein